MATTVINKNENDLFDALRCFSFAQQYHPMELAVFEKNFSSLGGGARSTENKNFRDALLFFRTHFYTKLLPGIDGAKTELERFSPLDVVERVGETATEETKLRRMDRHEFAQRLVSNFKERLELQLNKGEENALVEGVEGSLSKAAALASSTQELHNHIEEGLSELLLTHPDTQQKFINDQLAAKNIAREELEAGKQPPFQQILFSDPVNTTKAVIGALSPEVPDKGLFFRIAAALPMKHDESVDGFLAGVGQTTRAAVAATAELPTTDVSARAGTILPLLVQTGVGKLVVPIFAVLPQKIKDAVAIASVGRAWESAVGKITNSMGGALTPGLTQVIQQGNKYLGKTSGGPSFFGAVTDVFSPLLIGPIEPALYSYLQAHRANDLLLKNQRLFGDTTALSTALSTSQTQDGRGAVYLLFTAIVSGGQRDAHLKQEGSGSAWVVDLGGRLLGALTTKRAGGGVTGGFLNKLLGFFGVRFGAQAATGGLMKLLGFFSGFLSGGWGWVISIAGGLFSAPLFNKVKSWFSNLLSGRIGKLGTAEEQKKTDFYIALLVGAPIIILITASMFQITTQNSAIFIASFPSNTGGPYIESFPPYYGPFPEESPPLSSCPVSSAPITQKPFGDFSHEGVCAYDFGSQKGALVYATHDGCVAALRSDVPNDTFIEKEFGNYVRLAGTGPAGHYYTIYAHLVQGSGLGAGTCVRAGDVIGRVDTTGFTFDSNGHRGGGTHLHYQYNDGQKTCPSLPSGCGY